MTNRDMVKACLVLTGVACLLAIDRVECGRVGLARRSLNGEAVFDVMKYGALADGENDDAMAFVQAWIAACKNSTLPATVLIPKGNYMAGEAIFGGPCAANQTITFQIEGNITANPDSSLYVNGNWFMFQYVDNVVVTGGGTLNGGGAGPAPPTDGSGTDIEGDTESGFAVSIVFEGVGFTKLNNLNFVDSKTFHTKFHSSHDIEVTSLTITSPGNSFDTIGIQLSNVTNVNISDSTIRTGDDCISIGQASKNVQVTRVTCGLGHGISVGSLGKQPYDMGVETITVSNCTMVGTTNGVRIKTYNGAPKIEAKGIIFRDIIMTEVKNPIIIDQNYRTGIKPQSPLQLPSLLPSNVKITDTHFINIKGSTVSPIPINLKCSSASPCEGIELADIDLVASASASGSVGPLKSECVNAKTVVNGNVIPAAPVC